MAIDVQRVLVVGAGTMGSGIAQVASRAGYRTEVFDVAAGAAQRALDRIADSLSRAVEKGRCTAQEREESLARLAVASDLDAAAAQADLVVEAAPEDLKLKQDLFARISKVARADAILATNTSSLPRRAPTARAAVTTIGCVRSPWTISRSFIAGTGLKKWRPTTRSGPLADAAMAEMGSEEVLLARIASGLAILSSLLNTSSLTAMLS